jgi:hypothetical protein
MKPPKPSILCKRGHRKTGRNAIVRVRNGKKIVECRECARDGLNARREAKRRNEKLLNGEE